MSEPTPRTPVEQIWDRFCQEHGVANRVPLFHADASLTVQTIPWGRRGHHRRMLARAPEMERLVRAEARKLVVDHAEDGQRYDGLIYCMHRVTDGFVEPLYVGKAEKLGKKGGNLSANIKGVPTGNDGCFARWGYGYAYHVGDLSGVVLSHAGHDRSRKYASWAEALFEPPLQNLRLRAPVYLWVKAWEAGAMGLRGTWGRRTRRCWSTC